MLKVSSERREIGTLPLEASGTVYGKNATAPFITISFLDKYSPGVFFKTTTPAPQGLPEAGSRGKGRHEL
jgi:hypothetical protein